MEELYKQVKALFAEYHFPGHDFKHVQRTSKLAKKIAEAEGYDPLEAEVAGLLHDVGRTVKDSKEPHAKEGAPIAKKLLDKYTDFDEETKARIVKAVEIHSNRHTEGKLNNIVQDADKLDGMGAFGIARAYMSILNVPDFDPDNIYPTVGEYGKFRTVHDAISMQIEWYDMLYTEKAKELGAPRRAYMIAFMEEIRREVEESK